MYSIIKIQHTQFSKKQIFRNIFTSSIKYNISKQSKFINKFLKKDKSNMIGNSLIEDIVNPSPESRKNKLSIHTTRRINVLNKVFMEYITDMMSTGDIEPEILDRNIEISHIRITPDFKLINVYWIDNNYKKFENSDTEELLKKCAFKLRHELSQLRVIGMVPPIQFVKNKAAHFLKEVEKKLESLDFGEEHISSPYSNCIYYTVTSSGINEDISNNKGDNFSVNIPVMKHNVFGLNHFHIMSKIKVSLTTSKNTLKQEKKNPLSKLNIKDIQNSFDDDKQQELFAQFLNQRRKKEKRKIRDSRDIDNLIHNYESENNDDNLETDQNDCIDTDYNYFDDYEKFNKRQ